MIHRPTHLDTTTKSYFVSVSIDKLEAKYTGGQGIHEHDIGFVRSNASVPTERSVFYYEIEVKNAGLRRSITMGFTSKTTKLDKTMNWFEGLFGYRAKDGFKLRDGPKGESYGPTFTSTDIVGAGVDFQLMEIFFTKNGKHIGFNPAFQNVPGFLYPTIGLHSPGEHVSVNFGQKPFLFDIQKYISKRESEMTREISKREVSNTLMRSLVIDYLRHHGFERTYRALTLDESENSILSFRAKIRSKIMEGDCASVFRRLKECDESRVRNIISTRLDVMSRLHRQVFVELVRDAELEKAVMYARQHSKDFSSDSQVHALLAYKTPQSSPLRHYMSNEYRVKTANILNSALMEVFDEKKVATSNIDRLLHHTKVALDVQREIRGNRVTKYHCNVLGE